MSRNRSRLSGSCVCLCVTAVASRLHVASSQATRRVFSKLQLCKAQVSQSSVCARRKLLDSCIREIRRVKSREHTSTVGF